MPSTPVVRLTGRALRFLRLMQDLGHLDDQLVSDVLLDLYPPRGARGPVWADVDVVRSAVAARLFQRSEGAKMPPNLVEDWPLLFS
ncbi:MAG TPA: hypothetical protein PKA64_26035 [Myxococcota bacterium]|nr:hypothetical protein [Myxococcota bacterium]